VSTVAGRGQSVSVPDEVQEIDLGFVPDAGAPLPGLVREEDSTRLTFNGRRTTRPANASPW
jgi:hypothetical protein